MKQMIQRLSLGLAALLLLASPLKSAEAQRHFTGIQGQATLYISYGTPVEVDPGIWIGVPSLQLPVSAAFSVLKASNHREVARGTSDASGVFAVPLPPGKYILVPHDLTIGGFPFNQSITTSPIEVTVLPKRPATVNVFYFQAGPLTVFSALAR